MDSTADDIRIPGYSLGPAVAPFGDEVGTFQDRHVLLDRRKRHVVAVGQLRDRRLRPHDALENVASGGIGQGLKEPADIGWRNLAIYNQTVAR
ncbi:MAG: hypothetical protein Q7J25_03305 [Vicinamibacterales bacterium]|nr:hypothetical protein [Vicinamibacterales bacterium]